MTDAITYDDVYDLMRKEKSATDLEPLDAEVIERIKSYLTSKNSLLKQQSGGMFSGVRERVKIITEIENVQNVLRDLFERRERKIINRALSTVRTDLRMKDTTNMLSFEAELYASLLEILQKHLNALDLVGDIEESTAPVVEKPASGEVILEFIEDIPELIGSDLKQHGPFKKGDIATMPADLSELLLAKNQARVHNSPENQ